MADEITITGEVTYKAWITPKVAIVMIGETECKLPIEKLADAALVSLAQTWLNHLYSGLNRKPPVIMVGE